MNNQILSLSKNLLFEMLNLISLHYTLDHRIVFYHLLQKLLNTSNQQKNEIINDIEKDFNESLIGLKKLDKDSFLGVFVAYRYYKELLSKIKKSNLTKMKDVRIRISNFKKMALILNSAIKVNLKMV